jgi:membrane protein
MSEVGAGGVEEKPESGIKKLIARVMALRPVRVFQRFSSSGGNLLASGMSYQAVFAVFAALWVGFSIFGIVLESNPDLQQAVLDQLNNAVPGLIGPGGAIDPDALLSARILGWTGAIALAGLILTAVGWLASTRDAIRQLFRVGQLKKNFVILKLKDFGLAIAFAAAIIVSAALTTFTTQGLGILFDWIGIDRQSPPATVAGWVIGTAIALAFDTFVLASAFRVLSGVRIPFRRLVVGALIGAAAMEVLKILGSKLLGGATSNPLLASFAVIIGIMIWFNLICRVILISATWIAVGMDDAGIDPRALSPQEQEDERQRRVADARDVLVEAERDRLRAEIRSTKGLARRRARKQLQKLDEADAAKALELTAKR